MLRGRMPGDPSDETYLAVMDRVVLATNTKIRGYFGIGNGLGIPVADMVPASGQEVQNHFARLTKMVDIGSNTVREILNYKLDRYACYLIAQNGDSKKAEIAQAQTYFAIQTRKQELSQALSEDEKRIFVRSEVSLRNKELFKTARRAGVNKFGVFNDAGYRGLYGMPLSDVEKKKNVVKGGLLDRAGSIELAANFFRITQTEGKIKKDNVYGQEPASKTHFTVGSKV